MGKSFSQSGGPVSTRERLSKLRSLLGDHSLDALVVPTDDSHASEYVCCTAKCLSGFRCDLNDILHRSLRVMADESLSAASQALPA